MVKEFLSFFERSSYVNCVQGSMIGMTRESSAIQRKVRAGEPNRGSVERHRADKKATGMWSQTLCDLHSFERFQRPTGKESGSAGARLTILVLST